MNYCPSSSSLVELQVENSLPLTEDELPVDDWHGQRTGAGDHLTHMGVSVDELVFLQILGAKVVIVVLVVDLCRHDPIEGREEIVVKARLYFVDGDRRGGVRSRDRHLAMADGRLANQLTHILRDIEKLPTSLAIKVEDLGQYALRSGECGGSALRSGCGTTNPLFQNCSKAIDGRQDSGLAVADILFAGYG